ncbi:hypothetical protein NM688_g2090 [Phlebia brevispora]|uniref:Uncharacterized protein n=1 Tax=Phlebia brevispora TaxID=194682 RepID=A0ACC1T9N1_9APHY|nr:hypothetical protein NM688_g2090 [Phlebia brevispora]
MASVGTETIVSLEEERGVMSEPENQDPKAKRRRIFGRSAESSSLKEKATSLKESKESSSTRHSKDSSAATLNDGSSKLSAGDEVPPMRRHSKKKSTDDRDKKADRLSLFGGSFSGAIVKKARKPVPRLSSGGLSEKSEKGEKDKDKEKTKEKTDKADHSDKPEKGEKGDHDWTSLATFTRMRHHSERRVSGRPSTSDGAVRKEKDKRRESSSPRDTALLRKRTSSMSDGARTPNPAVQAGGMVIKPGRSILEQIGTPDHNGWMRKKSDHYSSWKLRYFVLKGPHLYCLKSNDRSETKIKGYINIVGYKVIADENIDPGRYGFRIVHDSDKTHYFSHDEQMVIREWMKALMKATISRDFTNPVVSSSNIPTIPLTVAQAMNPSPRPPSPTARAATQRAHRRENPNQLSSRDAQILLMGQKSPSLNSPSLNSPSLNGSFQDGERTRAESFFTTNAVPSKASEPASPKRPLTPKAPAPPRPSREMRRKVTSPPPEVSDVARHRRSESNRGIHQDNGVLDDSLIDWANSHLPHALQITDPSGPLCGGLGLLRIAEDIKGVPSSPPVPDSAFPSASNDEKLDGLFALFDYLLDNDVKIGAVSINDIRQNSKPKIIQILHALRSWEEKRQAVNSSLSHAQSGAGYMSGPVSDVRALTTSLDSSSSTAMSLDIQSLQSILLTGNWIDTTQESSWLHDLTRDVVNGAFREVLTSSRSRDFFAIHQSLTDVSDRPLDQWFEFASSSEITEEQEFLRLLLAIACLQAFLQVNWTGPDLNLKASDILTVPSTLASDVTEELLQQKSLNELAYGGEPAYHLAELSLLLRLAKILLELPYIHCRSAAWWRLRAWLVHEHVLDEPAATPAEVLAGLQSPEQFVTSDADLDGRVLLEQGLLNHTLSQDKAAAELFVRAARATQLEYELTGALGKRTKFQNQAITQLVLLAESRPRDRDATSEHKHKTAGVAMPETLALNDDTLLEQTQFTSSFPAAPGSRLAHLDPSNQPPLDPLDQCILLAMCLNVKNTSPAHGLTAEQMAPYVDRVIAHARNWSVHTMALLLRSRLEAARTRTVERSTLQLQALVDQMPTADSTVQERLRYIHDLCMPSKWELQRELALRFFGLGVVKSALEIFERLEMWEEVVKCWQSMERPEKGIAVVRDLLEGRKAEAEIVIAREKATTDSRKQYVDAAREAKLWCLLGDLEPANAVEHYTKAWEISKHTSGRAMRSLGGYYFARGDFDNTITCLRHAVAINPLLTRSWFILGCAYVRKEDWEGARDAFTRCIAIDDEDGESWNNLASVYLRMGEAGHRIEAEQDGDDELESAAGNLSISANEQNERIPFTNRLLAFRALKQGLRFNYDNWRMWSNYMIVAMDVGELSEACRALGLDRCR